MVQHNEVGVKGKGEGEEAKAKGRRQNARSGGVAAGKGEYARMREAEAWRGGTRTQDARRKTQDCRQICAKRDYGGVVRSLLCARMRKAKVWQHRLASWVLRLTSFTTCARYSQSGFGRRVKGKAPDIRADVRQNKKGGRGRPFRVDEAMPSRRPLCRRHWTA